MKGHAPDKVAHFLNRIVFCLFAEDVNLLQDDLFKRMLDTLAQRRDEVPERSQRCCPNCSPTCAAAANSASNTFCISTAACSTTTRRCRSMPTRSTCCAIAKQDWSSIDPTIFGTLFERFLDPDKRAQIGAHYTDPEKIMMIVNPVIVRPLTAEWEAVKAELKDILSRNRKGRHAGQGGRSTGRSAARRLPQAAR